jgi:hypothetical protein
MTELIGLPILVGDQAGDARAGAAVMRMVEMRQGTRRCVRGQS